VLNEGVGTEDHPWGAKTTLDSTVVDEGSLDRMKLSLFGDPLDRRDLLPFTGNCQEEAAVLGLSVDQDSAGSAHAAVTAFLGSRQPELIPEHIQESFSLSNGYRMFIIVDSQDENLEVTFNRHSVYAPFVEFFEPFGRLL
jgi:hypothetical protein